MALVVLLLQPQVYTLKCFSILAPSITGGRYPINGNCEQNGNPENAISILVDRSVFSDVSAPYNWLGII